MRDHGTNSAYTAGCRCAPCSRAHADYEHERRHRASKRPNRTPAKPWMILLRQLTLPQVTIDQLAEATGLRTEALYDLRAGRHSHVNRRTREALERFVATLPSEESA